LERAAKRRAPSIAKVFGDISDPVRRADPEEVGIGADRDRHAASVLVLLRTLAQLCL
jgi:hypothetical protein